MKCQTAALTSCCLMLCSAVIARESPTRPMELAALGQYVGHWTSDVTSKPAVWDEKGTEFRTVNQAEWILDGWFLQHLEVNHVVGDPKKTTKSLSFWTYDSKLAKFVVWTFQSNGNVDSFTGKWDSVSKAFALAAVEPPPNMTGKMTEQFVDAKTMQGNLTHVDDSGRTLLDMVWTRNRQPESAGKTTREEWSKLGTPAQPLPDELKTLQPWIGEWDSEFNIVGPSVGSPKLGIRSQGKMTVQRVLDGHYFLIATESGKDRFLWMMGYDRDKRQYRRITFTNAGQIGESVGAWNAEFDTIDWHVVNERPGSFLRFIGQSQRAGSAVIGQDSGTEPHPNDGQQGDYTGMENGVLKFSILRHDAKGKFYESLGIRSTRRK